MDVFNDWDIVLLASDDMIPQIEGYDDIIREEMKNNHKSTDGVLWFHDGYRTDLNTLCILGKKYYDRFGYIYNPEYSSLWCDNEFTEVANNLGKQVYINNCIIRHEHLIWIGGQNDHLATRNEKFYGEDFKIYEKRKSDNFGLKNKKKKKSSTLNRFVDQVYVINLDRRQDRLIHITSEFKKIGVDFKKFKAIDGLNLKVHKELLKNSQLACLRSHIGVLKDALEKGHNKIAVFEDDVVFCEDFEKRFEHYAENIPKDWDVMFLG
jgi:GR25 family glycosyltransferase involved in LPS biosynthesis